MTLDLREHRPPRADAGGMAGVIGDRLRDIGGKPPLSGATVTFSFNIGRTIVTGTEDDQSTFRIARAPYPTGTSWTGRVLSIDRAHGFIRKFAVTSAAAHDGAQLKAVLDKDNTASSVWADTAYRSKANEAHLARHASAPKFTSGAGPAAT